MVLSSVICKVAQVIKTCAENCNSQGRDCVTRDWDILRSQVCVHVVVTLTDSCNSLFVSKRTEIDTPASEER